MLKKSIKKIFFYAQLQMPFVSFIFKEHDRMLNLHATTIQRTVRGWIDKKRFVHMRMAAIIIQRYWRGYIYRQRYKQVIRKRVDEIAMM